MYIKRLAEIFVQKAFLIFEIKSFEVYCRSMATLRLNDSLQRLKILSILGDSAYIFLAL
jgi:hypothetical protein